MDQTALQPGRAPRGFAAGLGPDSPETTTPGLLRTGRTPRGLPPHGEKQGNDAVAGHRGHCPAPDVRGRGETPPATTTCFPAPGGLLARARALGHARPWGGRPRGVLP